MIPLHSVMEIFSEGRVSADVEALLAEFWV